MLHKERDMHIGTERGRGRESYRETEREKEREIERIYIQERTGWVDEKDMRIGKETERRAKKRGKRT